MDGFGPTTNLARCHGNKKETVFLLRTKINVKKPPSPVNSYLGTYEKMGLNRHYKTSVRSLLKLINQIGTIGMQGTE